MLETKGRQSGKIRKVPLTYAEIDNGFIVAASYGGRDKTPNWFYNLENSNTFVTVHKDRLKVRTELVQDNELEYFWNKLIAIYPTFIIYKQRTSRKIPLVKMIKV